MVSLRRIASTLLHTTAFAVPFMAGITVAYASAWSTVGAVFAVAAFVYCFLTTVSEGLAGDDAIAAHEEKIAEVWNCFDGAGEATP